VSTDRQATHRDYVAIIGGTAATAKGWYEKRMNVYYLTSSQQTVGALLDPAAAGSILDVGTSHGNWLRFLRGLGFGRVLGVEIDQERAELARRTGYDEVFNTDAAELPCAPDSVDQAVSNDVFVHILRLEDKAAVLKEVERVLRPGGVFVFNQPMSRAFGHSAYTVEGYCSYMTLDEILRLVAGNTGFVVEDVKPGYFANGSFEPSRIERAVRSRMWIPGSVSMLLLLDRLRVRSRELEQSDFVYFKLRKPTGA
jgi:SAM-dependent methyltransferase